LSLYCIYVATSCFAPALDSRSQISRLIAVNYVETNQAVKIVPSFTFYTEYRKTKS